MFEATFKNIDDILHKDAGCSSELDYIEQTSWLLFLKYLDDLEIERESSSTLSGRAYLPIISTAFRWQNWASPKGADGKLDHNNAMTGDDLLDFANSELFPYLSEFRSNDREPDSIEYKVGEIFSELRNRIQSGYNLREVIDRVDELHFRSYSEKHEMSYLYEDKIKNMGNAGRNGGEYYTPRPLIKAIVQVVDPQIGQRIYDGAAGSAGFLVEAYEHIRLSKELSTSEAMQLQRRTLYGQEKKSLAYIIGTMNMILHGIDAPNIVHTNTLARNLNDVQDSHRFDVVLANPPFGGKERKEVQQNFPIKTAETAFLFLQHFIRMLRPGGTAGIVIKNTFLSNTDNAAVSLRKLLLDSCELQTILDLPQGTFQGAGVKTVVLFFTKAARTKSIWYYKLNPGRNMGKTSPLSANDLADFLALQKTFAESVNSWNLDVKDVEGPTWDLTVRNPLTNHDSKYADPLKLLDSILLLDSDTDAVLRGIRSML